MPVSLRKLRGTAAEPVRGDSIARRALDLLRGTPGEAWRPMELAEKLGIPQTTLSPQLSRLRQRGLIENEQGHWYALADREVAKRLAMRMGDRRANEKWGREDPGRWKEVPRE